jgi:hypothetical protein
MQDIKLSSAGGIKKKTVVLKTEDMKSGEES